MTARVAMRAPPSTPKLFQPFLNNGLGKAPVPRKNKTGHLVVKDAQSGVPGDGSIPTRTNSDKIKIQSFKSTAAESLLSKIVSDVLSKYKSMLEKHPVATKAVTSLIGFAIGDSIAQSFLPQPFDLFRFLRLSLYGFLIDGPIGHHFYFFLDTKIKPENPKGAEAVLVKTAIDQLLWAPAMTVVFLAFLTTLEGHPNSIISVIQAKLLPIYLANLGVWPLFHLINFRFIPPAQRILFNNAVSIVWTTYLSFTCGSVGGAVHTCAPSPPHVVLPKLHSS